MTSRISQRAPLLAALVIAAWACGSSEQASHSTSGFAGATATSGASSSSSSAGPGADGFLGFACETDGDCGGQPEAHCIRDTDHEALFTSFFFGSGEPVTGGPAHGYCTTECITSADCPTDGICITTGSRGICALSCEFGEPQGAIDDAQPVDKCRGRDDLMCSLVQTGVAVCMPICGDASDCSEGRSCDARLGLCVNEPRTGRASGAECEPDDPETADNEDVCAGLCATFQDSLGEMFAYACSSRCSLGGEVLNTTDCGGTSEGLCAHQPVFDGVKAGLGDSALCAGACTSHSACSYPHGMFCFDMGLHASVGKGYCWPSISCPVGDECEADHVCVDTRSGPFCLQGASPAELVYDLGEAAPAGSGGSGAGGAGGAGAGGSGVGGS